MGTSTVNLREVLRKSSDDLKRDAPTRQVVVAESAGGRCLRVTRGASNQMARRPGGAFLFLPLCRLAHPSSTHL